LPVAHTPLTPPKEREERKQRPPGGYLFLKINSFQYETYYSSMMPELDRIYDSAFFQEWGPTHGKYVRSAEIVTQVLHDIYAPKRLIDLGSGCGVYGHFFSLKGVSVVSIDGVQPPSPHAYPLPVHVQDLTVPFENRWGCFDAALCLEVAEHIPETLLSPFLANITQFSDRLILSAAPPGQGGHHHVNEQPRRYWVEQLARVGFAYNRKHTGRVFETLNAIKLPYMWMAGHIGIYDRILDPTIQYHLPFAVRQR